MNDFTVFRQARQAAGLTYREVAEAARLDPSAIAHYEVGRVRPSPASRERGSRPPTTLLPPGAVAVGTVLNQL